MVSWTLSWSLWLRHQLGSRGSYTMHLQQAAAEPSADSFTHASRLPTTDRHKVQRPQDRHQLNVQVQHVDISVMICEMWWNDVYSVLIFLSWYNSNIVIKSEPLFPHKSGFRSANNRSQTTVRFKQSRPKSASMCLHDRVDAHALHTLRRLCTSQDQKQHYTKHFRMFPPPFR